MRIEQSTIGSHTFLVHVDPGELDCGSGKMLPYGTCIGTFNLWGIVNDWTPAASHPRGYGAAARALLRETMESELAKRDLRPVSIGTRVELHPGCDLWMRGARYGQIARLGRPGYPELVAVRMDHPQVKTLQWFRERDLLTIAR